MLWQPRPLHLQLLTVGQNKNRFTFKPERGVGTKEGRLSPSRKGNCPKGAPGWDIQDIKCHTQTPFLNLNPFNQWYGIENIARIKVNRESCMALLDNGAQINTITPGYIENHSLDVRPLPDLVGRWVTCVGLGNSHAWPIGYVIIWIQVDRVQGYDEDQIALLILDFSNFAAMIGHIMNVIKEREMDVLATPSVNVWVAYLLVVWWAMAKVEDNKVTTKVLDPTDYDEVVTTEESELVNAFSSKIIHTRTKPTFNVVRFNVMTQALCAEEGSLPQGLMIQNTYTEMFNGSKSVALLWWEIVHNTPRPWGRRSQWQKG